MKNSIRKYLSKTDTAKAQDIKRFSQWADEEISTSECLSHFRYNNRINTSVKIDEKEFEKWLNSLGYAR